MVKTESINNLFNDNHNLPVALDLFKKKIKNKESYIKYHIIGQSHLFLFINR